ncbi:15088_t:CDS:1 [Dentiscutata heterogama]|uniref:15088_t:CDS:1 n=1 Tax=Dentiscutata heterogama TaxID=1316150 RepID=A0ACA9NJP1_9GLOM|nr:15088_t:CDS:1 [Dentiscutata heterogama]
MSSQERQNLQQSQNPKQIKNILKFSSLKKMSSRTRQKLIYAGKSFEEIYLYVHTTLGNYYALRSIDLSQAAYTVEYLTFPLIANEAKDLLKLKELVFKSAQELGINIEGSSEVELIPNL